MPLKYKRDIFKSEIFYLKFDANKKCPDDTEDYAISSNAFDLKSMDLRYENDEIFLNQYIEAVEDFSLSEAEIIKLKDKYKNSEITFNSIAETKKWFYSFVAEILKSNVENVENNDKFLEIIKKRIKGLDNSWNLNFQVRSFNNTLGITAHKDIVPPGKKKPVLTSVTIINEYNERPFIENQIDNNLDFEKILNQVAEKMKIKVKPLGNTMNVGAQYDEKLLFNFLDAVRKPHKKSKKLNSANRTTGVFEKILSFKDFNVGYLDTSENYKYNKNETPYRDIYNHLKNEVNVQICEAIVDSLNHAGFTASLNPEMHYDLIVNTIPMQVVNNYEVTFDNERIYGIINGTGVMKQQQPKPNSWATQNPEVFKILLKHGLDSTMGGPKFNKSSDLAKFFEDNNIDFYLRSSVQTVGKLGVWEKD